MKYSAASFGDFRCAHCHNIVPAAHIVSGVNNRNHCPYCLWSFHLDLFVAGDRLSACKGQMRPIGLTMKKSRNKYQIKSRGELMLIHECIECRTLSINRIAADDDPEAETGERRAADVAQFRAGEAEIRTPVGQDAAPDAEADASREDRHETRP